MYSVYKMMITRHYKEINLFVNIDKSTTKRHNAIILCQTKNTLCISRIHFIRLKQFSFTFCHLMKVKPPLCVKYDSFARTHLHLHLQITPQRKSIPGQISNQQTLQEENRSRNQKRLLRKMNISAAEKEIKANRGR